MRITTVLWMILGATLVLPTILTAQSDTVKYVPRVRYPVLDQIEDRADSLQAIRDSITDAIRELQDSLATKADDERRRLRFDFTGITKPASPEIFQTPFHFAPVGQDLTGTCWCFAGTSFLESEICRLTGLEIDLSEMYTVYYEYVEKARYFVQRRGDYDMGEGGFARRRPVRRILRSDRRREVQSCVLVPRSATVSGVCQA